ncbi:MAG: glycosyltransferase family 39 protein [Phycisphaerae bacterium]|nr:glycosyltransferase family 39 protein [Phycisphaerae bacterium]
MPAAAALILVVVGSVLVGVFAESPAALSVVLTDGLLAVALLTLATIPGSLCLRGLAPREESLVGRMTFSAGLGVGVLCLLQLVLGACGSLTRGAWLAGFGFLVLASLAVLARPLRDALRRNATLTLPAISGLHWLWLAVVPFAALTLLVATAPPGILWGPEGNGYDVLEYHFGVPAEYLAAGRIGFLPHNVYSNFPFNAEMLYLLAMVLRGGAIEGVELAKMLNALLALLTIAAMWTAARPQGPRAALLAAVLTGTCGWLVYLSGVAYVENAMLLFTSLALAALMRWHAAGDAAEPDARAARWALLAGLFAGLACGCKYTAVALVALPLSAVFLTHLRRHTGASLRGLMLFGSGALLTFAPWLFKNVALCGNPVFPLATNHLGYRPGAWDADSAARWDEGHRPPAEQRAIRSRLRAVWSEVVWQPHTGPLLWCLALLGLIRGRPARAALVLIVAAQVLLWASLTHLAGRFAVPVIPILVYLAATADVWRRPRIAPALVGVVALAAVLQLYPIAALYYDHSRVMDADGHAARLLWHGQKRWFVEGQWPGTAHVATIRRELPPDGRCLMVADARSFYLPPRVTYCVVFNANPFARMVRDAGDAAGLLAELRRAGFTHVYVDWVEMRRLRATYGFWPEIDEPLFVRLERVGLRRIEDCTFGEGAAPYGTLYEVPQ